jgi:hypothetical protein
VAVLTLINSLGGFSFLPRHFLLSSPGHATGTMSPIAYQYPDQQTGESSHIAAIGRQSADVNNYGADSRPKDEAGLEKADEEAQAVETIQRSRLSGLPSPPLTRIGSKDSIRERSATHLTEDTVVDISNSGAQLDIYHPLVDEPTVSEANPDTTAVDVDITQADNIQPHLPVAIKRADRFIDAKPPSPQPWDLIQPPAENGTRAYDPHSPGSKFNTLQSTSTGRPLKPKSSYYFGPPTSASAYGTPPIGQIGLHHPREILRIERDYSGGELIQFSPIYPLELEGRVTPTQFLESINSINELLISAHSARHSFIDNTLALVTLQISRLFFQSHYSKMMKELESLIEYLNLELYNPVGLNMLWPRKVAFLFLEIEYY